MSKMNDYEIKLSCTMVELYLNQLNDLLLPKGAEPVPLDIKETPSGMIDIVGVTEKEIMSVSETDKIFEMGMGKRKTRATNMNDTSSRSHLIFAIKIDVYNVNTKQKTLGKISFVDLAGSEKSAKTGTTKEGQDEANAINMSLSALGNVIAALSEGGNTFIPYRNHVLTKLMKDSLGGTAKTLMFVNCSPSVYNEAETKNSLDYALRVKKIKNNVSKNIETKESLRLKGVLQLIEQQIETLAGFLDSSDKVEEYERLKSEFQAQVDAFRRNK